MFRWGAGGWLSGVLREGRLWGGVRAGIQHPGISIVSNLDQSGKPVRKHAGTGSQSLFWHTDNSYVERPPKGSLLYGVQTPVNGGGDTSFVNQYAAYETLSGGLKTRIDGLHVKQDTSRNTAGGMRPTASLPRSYDEVEGPVHPIVRLHPDTGRRALYLGRRYQAPSSHIVEMANAEPRTSANNYRDSGAGCWASRTSRSSVPG